MWARDVFEAVARGKQIKQIKNVDLNPLLALHAVTLSPLLSLTRRRRLPWPARPPRSG